MINNLYKNIRFAIYVRKSQEDKNRQVQSINSQIDVLTECAKREQLNIVKIYKDCGSAHKPNNRKQFNKLLQDINNKKIDGILCWKADRLARNHIEGGIVMHCLEKNIIQIIKTPDKIFLPTDNTVPLSIEFGMANQYSRDLSVNIKRGNKTKVKNGGWCHIAPQGYINDRLNRKVDIDPKRFHLVEKMWKLMLTGKYSIQQICDIANNQWGFTTSKRKNTGGIPIKKSTLHGVFINPFYYGYIKDGENQGWGSHKPMVNFKEFQKVQEILRKSGHKAKTSLSFAYSGVLLCGECGCSILGETKVKYKCPKCNKRQTAKHPKKCSCGYQITQKDINKGKFYTYYHCSKSKQKCSQKSVRKENLNSQFEDFVSQLVVNNDFVQWCTKWLDFLNDSYSENLKQKEKNKTEKYNSIKSKIMRLVDMRMNDEIDENLFKEKKTILDKQLLLLEKDDFNQKENIEEVAKTISFLENLEKEFSNAQNKEKKKLISQLASNPILMDGKVLIQAKKLYLGLQRLRVHKNLNIEPPKNRSRSDLNGQSLECCQLWCTILDENRTL